MGLFSLFAKQAPNRVFISIVLGALAGVSYALLIPLVLGSLADINEPKSGTEVHTFLGFEVTNYKFAVAFAVVCLFILGARSLSQVLLSRVALDATVALRVRTYRRIMRAPVAELEAIGSSRLYTAITTDVRQIVLGAGVIPNVLVALVTLLGMLAYVLVLSREVFLLVAGAIVFGVITYQAPMLLGRRLYERGRAKVDGLQEAIRGLIYGNKELKLSKVKKERYMNEILLATEAGVNQDMKRANTVVTIAGNYGQLLSFLVIGVVSFIFVSYNSISAGKLIGVVMALLYISGPVALILNSLPQLMLARVSLRNVDRLFSRLTEEEVEDRTVPVAPWNSIRFSNVSYAYGTSDHRFKLGPVDLEIARGQITFIVGGNGSGKSTLCKLIALHYAPSEGSIFFDDTRIDRDAVASYRESIAAIFPDYYLFDRLLSMPDADTVARVRRYLFELDLAKAIIVNEGRFSTTALSDGQRKRLALLVTFVEDRDLYIFDEWAADQDPTFKKVFYREILPALKARNKAVVVISHDDRYFDAADQLIVMEEGKIVRTEPQRLAMPFRRADAELDEDMVSGELAAV